MEPGTEVDLAYFPPEVQKSKNLQNLLNIIKMIGKTLLERYLIKAADKEEVKNNYNNYIDFLKFSLNKR
jgi:hypothetical protein